MRAGQGNRGLNGLKRQKIPVGVCKELFKFSGIKKIPCYTFFWPFPLLYLRRGAPKQEKGRAIKAIIPTPLSLMAVRTFFILFSFSLMAGPSQDTAIKKKPFFAVSLRAPPLFQEGIYTFHLTPSYHGHISGQTVFKEEVKEFISSFYCGGRCPF